jgi:hypothetical protein
LLEVLTKGTFDFEKRVKRPFIIIKGVTGNIGVYIAGGIKVINPINLPDLSSHILP